MVEPTALITGITGQDGGYLRDFLLRKGYHVHGLVSLRPRSTPLPKIPGVTYHRVSLEDFPGLSNLIETVQPTEVYHLAAQSSGRSSFQHPIETATVNAVGTLKLLEAIRISEEQTGNRIRFFHASSGEMFGPNVNGAHTEESPLRPRSPYGTAKVFAHFSVINYRNAYGMHASNGFLFNHESPRRGEDFVTRKISRAAARIACGLQSELKLGRLDGQRDWGFAGDYVEAMWLMLQQDKADDYILATGQKHTVLDFVQAAFDAVGLDVKTFVQCDQEFVRPNEVDCLLGDPTKARAQLGWKPRVGFSELVRLMVEADLDRASREQQETLRRAG